MKCNICKKNIFYADGSAYMRFTLNGRDQGVTEHWNLCGNCARRVCDLIKEEKESYDD